MWFDRSDSKYEDYTNFLLTCLSFKTITVMQVYATTLVIGQKKMSSDTMCRSSRAVVRISHIELPVLRNQRVSIACRSRTAALTSLISSGNEN